jgi:hypothetical protein
MKHIDETQQHIRAHGRSAFSLEEAAIHPRDSKTNMNTHECKCDDKGDGQYHVKGCELHVESVAISPLPWNHNRNVILDNDGNEVANLFGDEQGITTAKFIVMACNSFGKTNH